MQTCSKAAELQQPSCVLHTDRNCRPHPHAEKRAWTGKTLRDSVQENPLWSPGGHDKPGGSDAGASEEGGEVFKRDLLPVCTWTPRIWKISSPWLMQELGFDPKQDQPVFQLHSEFLLHWCHHSHSKRMFSSLWWRNDQIWPTCKHRREKRFLTWRNQNRCNFLTLQAPNQIHFVRLNLKAYRSERVKVFPGVSMLAPIGSKLSSVKRMNCKNRESFQVSYLFISYYIWVKTKQTNFSKINQIREIKNIKASDK